MSEAAPSSIIFLVTYRREGKPHDCNFLFEVTKDLALISPFSNAGARSRNDSCSYDEALRQHRTPYHRTSELGREL